jgi:hypothetical protein
MYVRVAHEFTQKFLTLEHVTHVANTGILLQWFLRISRSRNHGPVTLLCTHTHKHTYTQTDMKEKKR